MLRDRSGFPDIGLAVILLFIGAKLMLTEVVEISVGVSLLVLGAVMTPVIVASLMRSGPRAGRA